MGEGKIQMTFAEVKLGYPIGKAEFKAARVGGSILHHDAEILYSYVRAYQPAHILELGAFVGVSTNVLIRAVRENRKGHIVSLDKFAPGQEFKFGRTTDTTIGWVGRHRSELVPDEDLDIVTMETGDVIEFVKGLPDRSYDFIFEDTNHHRATIVAVVPEFKRILKFGGVVLFHNTDLKEMEKGLRDVGVYTKMSYFKKVNGSSIGLLTQEDLCKS